MNVFTMIAERRIEESMRKGEFENLEGMGRPLLYEDDSMVPEDLRMAYKILKNAGFVPPEVIEEKEIATMTDLLAEAPDERDRYRAIQKLNVLITQFNMRRRRPVNFEKEQLYYEKIVERVPVRERKNKKENGA